MQSNFTTMRLRYCNAARVRWFVESASWVDGQLAVRACVRVVMMAYQRLTVVGALRRDSDTEPLVVLVRLRQRLYTRTHMQMDLRDALHTHTHTRTHAHTQTPL